MVGTPHPCVLCRRAKHTHPQCVFHRFPKEGERSITWQNVVKSPHIEGKTVEQLHRSYKVCSLNFSPRNYVSGLPTSRLRSDACPDQNLESNQGPPPAVAQPPPPAVAEALLAAVAQPPPPAVAQPPPPAVAQPPPPAVAQPPPPAVAEALPAAVAQSSSSPQPDNIAAAPNKDTMLTIKSGKMPCLHRQAKEKLVVHRMDQIPETNIKEEVEPSLTVPESFVDLWQYEGESREQAQFMQEVKEEFEIKIEDEFLALPDEPFIPSQQEPSGKQDTSKTRMSTRHCSSTHPSSQIHPQDGGPLTATPIKNIRKGLEESKIEAELDKTVTSTVLGSDSDTTHSSSDGYGFISDSSASSDIPEHFHKGKGKEPLIKKGQFYGKGEKRQIASDSQPPSVSAANVAQRTTSPFPSRSQSPDSSSSGSSMDLKLAKTIRVKRVKHITRGNRKEKLRRVTTVLPPAPLPTASTIADPVIATTTTDTPDPTAATASLSLEHKKQPSSISSGVLGKKRSVQSGQGKKHIKKVTGSLTTTTSSSGITTSTATQATTAPPATHSCDVFVWNDGSDFILDSPAFDMTNAGIQPAFPVHAGHDYVEYFVAFLDESILQQICEESNRYHEWCTTSDTVLSAKTIQWTPLSVREMYVFLALMLLMPHVQKYDLDDYWSHEDIIYTPIFGKYMSRDRFRAIYSYLHFAHNMYPSDTDPLWKIKEMMNNIKEKFRAFFKPMQKVVLDKSLVLFRGCISFKQYIPSKQHHSGIKYFVLCDCETGYILDFIIYSASEVDIKKTDPLLFSGSVVKVLLEKYFGENHVLYTDNYDTSPILTKYLKEHGMGTVGTIRQNRKHLPVFPESCRGEVQLRKSGKMLAMRWHDKKPINMLTTEHVGHLEDSGKTNLKMGEKIMKPDAVIDDNINMRLVDKSDMMIGFIDCLRKGCKWYKKSFLHIIDMCLLNAYILFKTQVGEQSPPSLRQFSRTVITQLLERFGQVTGQAPRRHSDALPDRLEARDYLNRHYIESLPPTSSRNVGVGRCYVCSHSSRKPKVRKQTSYKCHECKVPLCIVPCFREYHTFKTY
ncbi:uncharacterized protein LOC135108529 isoform X2 [Scylla paramamosain]|uniref:uncharacterized protein LOC135108529 isoform X2 n=1 Tax=Scylla paramamosain TaxID=85552 RepID=UPI0030833F27